VPARIERPQFAPIAVAEAAPFLVPPPGATVVRAVAKARTEKVDGAWCMSGAITDAAATVERQAAAVGWDELERLDSGPERAVLSAVHGEIRLYATIQRGKWAECDQDEGRVLVTLGAHKRLVGGGGGGEAQADAP
jgi:hypothetical protein